MSKTDKFPPPKVTRYKPLIGREGSFDWLIFGLFLRANRGFYFSLRVFGKRFRVSFS